jgi:DNA-binding transcriptional regulator GbsR (MarR family)
LIWIRFCFESINECIEQLSVGPVGRTPPIQLDLRRFASLRNIQPKFSFPFFFKPATCLFKTISSICFELNGVGSMTGAGERLEYEAVEFFVRLADMISLPRSYGEIYGCLYISSEPLCMEDLISKLKISKGTASQGLRALRNIGAIKTVYKVGERRDYYEAECELRKLVGGFLRDQVNPHLDSGKERVERMHAILNDIDGEDHDFFQERVDRLGKWRQRADTILPWAIKMIEK